MLSNKIAPFLIVSVLIPGCAVFAIAQDTTNQSATAQQTPDPQQQQEEKLKLERKASALLEQVITEAQSLRLPENRIRVQIASGDMLWDRNAARARGLFADAGAIIGQMNIDSGSSYRSNRTDRMETQTLNRLRQDLVLTVARHDAELAYQLLRSTTPQTASANSSGRRFGPQDNLEQNLLAAITATDPKMAYQKAAESLDKGEYPSALNRVLAQLQAKDEEAFKKLSEKTLTRLSSDSLLGSRDASNLALGLLFSGPRPAGTSTSGSTSTTVSNTSGPTPVLSETAYHDLMDNTITAALTITSMGNVNVRGVVGGAGGGGGRNPMRAAQPNQQNPPDDAQIRQGNARVLLMSLQAMLPQIDQYVPERSQAVRQKLADVGISNNSMINFGGQMRAAIEQGTSESLATAASTAPPQLQPRLYQQAAMRAIEEGNTDRALQLANDHLDEQARNSVTQAVEFKRLATTASPEKLNDVKLKLASLPSDSDRVRFLLDLTTATQKDNPKLALRFLEDARNLVSKRATSYRELEDQLRVARAFGPLDSKRSFEVLEQGIAQLNELLAAAQVLNGFEVDVFKEGELSFRGGSELVSMLSRFGQELALLAKIDFESARNTADRFQLAEPRLNAKLSIVQSILGTQPPPSEGRRNQGIPFFAR